METEDIKSMFLKIRCNSNERMLIVSYAQRANLSTSAYIRKKALNENIMNLEDRMIIKQLLFEINKIGTNINQIAKNNNSALYSKDDKDYLMSVINDINASTRKTLDLISNNINT